MKFSFDRLITRGLKTWERHPSSAWVLSIGWILLISFVAFFWNLGNTGLLDETEPLFVEASRQMTITGDWITPYFNGVTRFDKPPLIYWCQAIAFLTFGVNEFAARLPSALAGLALTGFCFYTLRYFGSSIESWKPGTAEISNSNSQSQWQSWLVASLGAAMVALNPLTLFFGRTGYSDMLLSFCFGGALLAFFLGYAQPEQRKVQERWYLAFYVLSALAVLTKGPVGIVLPGLIIAAFLLYVGRLREVLEEMRVVRGGLIFLAIAVPWFILVTLRNGEAYIDSFFGYHNFERFTSVVNQHGGPWYQQILVMLVGFTPWTVALPAAIAQIKVLQRQRWQKSPRSTHLGLFTLFWFAIVLGFFTVAATKYFSYTLPLMPAAAILVALWWSDQIAQGQIFQHTVEQTGTPVFSLKLTSIFSIVIFLTLAGASYYCPHWLNDDSSMPNLGVLIDQYRLNVVGAVIWGASALAGTAFLLRRQAYWLWGVSFLGFVAFLMFVIIPASGIIDSERQLPLRQIAESVMQVQEQGEKLVMITDGFEKPTLVFYTQRHVTFVHDSTKALVQLKNVEKESNTGSVLLIATRESLEKTGLQPNQYQPIRNAGMYQLVRVPRARIV
ncbi:glycosyltransferase family 39 protein [Allocoleopsis sp.]|uniref:ArnT family glycosyltransferase n=1 Tax=Allocoleopsis sp. TaxID=3088169 RepID=UPI002FD348A7